MFFLIVVVSMTCNALDLRFGPLLYHDLCPVFVWIPGRLTGQEWRGFRMPRLFEVRGKVCIMDK